jgi:LacI family gluconate utilization system Gnt-I transcriptional repressor
MVMLHQSGVPVVETWDRPAQPIDAAIGYSNAEAGRLAAQYLISLGHTRIAALGAREDLPQRDFRGEQRLAGFSAMLREAGLSDQLMIRVDSPPVSFTQGATAMRQLLQQAPDVEAVFVVSDLPAVGAVMECHRRGVGVPEQISIMGFGNFEVGAQCHPSLTTISVDAQQIGRRTGEYLMARLAGDDDGGAKAGLTLDLGFQLLVRGSTRAAGG